MLETYHLNLKPRSPCITPLQSDTLFGHIAWAMRYVFGEAGLQDFLQEYQPGQPAPLIVSDGFQNGLLPKPFFRSLTVSRVTEVIADLAKQQGIAVSSRQLTEILKSLKKQQHLPIATWQRLQQDLSAENLLQVSLEALDLKATLAQKKSNGVPHAQPALVYHNTVNRVLNQVTEGFYQQETQFYSEDFSYDVYLKSRVPEADLRQIFNFIAISGFGRDKSTGKGQFEITLTKSARLPSVTDPNAFMVLSHYVPNPGAPKLGFYQFMTKYGRLGGDYAKAAIPDVSALQPFKKPIVMMKPGSVFFGPPSDDCGMLLGGENAPVHTHPAIRHYAWAYTFPVKAQEEDFTV